MNLESIKEIGSILIGIIIVVASFYTVIMEPTNQAAIAMASSATSAVVVFFYSKNAIDAHVARIQDIVAGVGARQKNPDQ